VEKGIAMKLIKITLVTYCSFPPHHHPETGPQQDHPVSVYPA
jgi:hypothetical protein